MYIGVVLFNPSAFAHSIGPILIISSIGAQMLDDSLLSGLLLSEGLSITMTVRIAIAMTIGVAIGMTVLRCIVALFSLGKRSHSDEQEKVNLRVVE